MITHPPFTHIDTVTPRFVMSRETHADFCNIVSMLNGLSSMAHETTHPSSLEVMKDFSGMLKITHDGLKRILEGLEHF
jgi:hypothetical protein